MLYEASVSTAYVEHRRCTVLPQELLHVFMPLHCRNMIDTIGEGQPVKPHDNSISFVSSKCRHELAYDFSLLQDERIVRA